MAVSRKPRLSAIVAIYRDALAIPEMYQRLVNVCERVGMDGEFIFVNDASPDQALDVLRELADKDQRVVVITHTRNFGSQSAFSSGMRVATGDAVVLMDGDLQDPPELIQQMVEKWRDGFEVVYGIRVSREAPLHMQFFYKMFYRLFRATSYVKVPVDAGDFSLLDRCVVDALNQLPESNRFIRGLRAWVGFRQTGVPYIRPDRPFGTSTNSLLKNIGWARKAILSFSYAPLELITVLAFGCVAAALLAIIGEIALRLLVPSSTPSGFATLIILILFMGGVQLLCLAIIGSYLAHIYEEVKHRPAYIVRDILNDPRSGQVDRDA